MAPPMSSLRKTSTALPMTSDPSNNNPHYLNHNGVPPPRRSTAGRAIRTNTTRPTNYYARPFGSMAAGSEHDANVADQSTQPAGFFPALTFFTDAITALPREVMKHYTLMKEVEAKIYSPTDQLGELLDTIMDQPVPARKQTATAEAQATTAQGLLSLTANNSTSGSANPSVVNGVGGRHSVQPSMAGSLDAVEAHDSEEELRRRHQFQELRMLTHSMLGNLDEKIVVLNEANRVLSLQNKRIDSVMPHIDGEISEEARLGSMTHWAYSENRQKTKATAAGANRPRDVAATNNLAAAAAAMHEVEIAQARNDAQREAAGAGRGKGKGKRMPEPAGDSDFDDVVKPRKAPKVGKVKAAAAANATGLGISTNGEPAPVKRKKNVEKAAAAPVMERQVSTQKGAKVKDTPRSTPAMELTVGKAKTAKAKPGPTRGKKTMPGSAQNSPMLASSPLASSFNPAMMEAPPIARPQSSRLRQNSAATNLRYERTQHDDSTNSRPVSAAGKPNGNVEKTANGRRRIQETTEEHDGNIGDDHNPQPRLAREISQKLKREEMDNMDASSGNDRGRPANSRSGSDRGRNSGRGSKAGTPKTDSFPAPGALGSAAMARMRSTRRGGPGDRDSSSSEPQVQGTGIPKHRRNASNSHLVKQLAPFNKSPNLDRHTLDDDDDDEKDERSVSEDGQGEDGTAEDEAEAEARRATRTSAIRRPLSRRNTATSLTLRTSPGPLEESRESSPVASPPPTSTRQSTRSSGRNEQQHSRSDNGYSIAARLDDEPPALEEDGSEGDDDAQAEPEEDLEDDTIRVVDQEGDDSEHDPDDPNEQKYCYCNRGSYGEMVACDNDNCAKEWFHLDCTDLAEAPAEDDIWYCRDCRPKTGRVKGGRGGRGGKSGAP